MRYRCPEQSSLNVIKPTDKGGPRTRARRGPPGGRYRCPESSIDSTSTTGLCRNDSSTIRVERTLRAASRPPVRSESTIFFRGVQGRKVVNDPAKESRTIVGKPYKVYIGNLHPLTTQTELREDILGTVGPYDHATISAISGLVCDLGSLTLDKREHLADEITKCRRYAEVWYRTRSSAIRAIETLHNRSWLGWPLVVSRNMADLPEIQQHRDDVRQPAQDKGPVIINVGGRQVMPKDPKTWNAEPTAIDLTALLKRFDAEDMVRGSGGFY